MNELIEYIEGTTGFAFNENRRKDIHHEKRIFTICRFAYLSAS